ncbi:MAG TPA: hypothetical protein VF731_01850 [Solirubrobacterales bacterium]
MKHNLKVLALSVLAVTALGAIEAQGAQASFDTLRTFPAGSSAFVKAEADPSEPNQVLTLTTGGFSTTCKEFSTTGSTATDRSTEVTGEPHFGSCTTSLGEGGSWLSHGCHFKFKSETGASELAPIGFVCPSGEQSETQYSGCTLFFGSQTFNGAHYANVQSGAGEREMHLTVTIKAEMDLAYTSQGPSCALWGIPASGNQATYLGKLALKGVEDKEGIEGEQVGMTMETLSTTEMP